MKALTLAQPVASAMLIGGKRIENRTWTPSVHPTSKAQPALIKSEPMVIAVHAGAAWWDGLKDKGKSKTCPKLRTDVAAFVQARWRGAPVDLAGLPTSAILGAMRVVDFVHVDELRARVEVAGEAVDVWAIGPWCWMVDRVWVLDEPIPAAGALSLWPLSRINDGEADRILTELVTTTPGSP